MKTSRYLPALALLASVFLPSGLSAQNRQPSRVVVGVELDMEWPHPLVFARPLDADLTDMLYMGLVRATWRNGQMTYLTARQDPMAMAHRFARTPTRNGGMALTFNMRSDLRWSDGRPLTAHDVAWTFRALRSPELASPRQGMAEKVDSVVARNDSTVVFYFPHPTSEDLSIAHHPIVPAHAHRGVDLKHLRAHPSITQPEGSAGNPGLVTSGPFRVGRWARSSRITFVRNPYFRPAARVDEVVVAVIPDEEVRLVEFRKGNVDLLSLSLTRAADARARPGARVIPLGQRSYTFIGYNPVTVPAFRDPEIRRAFGMALNVPALMRALGIDDQVVRVAGPYPPAFRLFADSRVRPLPHDLAAARRILTQKGWLDRDGDGIREKDGQRLSFTYAVPGNNRLHEDIAVYAQHEWKKLGAEVSIQKMDPASLREARVKRTFQVTTYSWYIDLSGSLGVFFDPDARLNFTSYRNPAVGDYFRKAEREPDPASAARHWREAAYLIYRDQPYTWLWSGDRAAALSPRLRNAYVSLYGLWENPWAWQV
ncbi:MAG: ABC transporter substrate-binding protein, partial [Gemmatimonadota bacterium]|nr:ABC transporter substrate-binding protein [Gemmatimonadota bacterium]